MEGLGVMVEEREVGVAGGPREEEEDDGSC